MNYVRTAPSRNASEARLKQPRTARRVAIVAAHPDDEVVGASALLAELSHAVVIHVTDGAPANMTDARAAGFASRSDYAAARQREAEAALALAGISPTRVQRIGLTDQEASLHLVSLARRLAGTFVALRLELVLTHAYEGGHPDHDAAAFGVHAACALMRRNGRPAPDIIEMSGYHNDDGRMATGTFLPATTPEVARSLTELERALKQRMLACHATQAQMLSQFPVDRECYRDAPRYVFTTPPHAGTLFYEMFDWGMTGPRWRALAGAALRDLGLTEPL